VIRKLNLDFIFRKETELRKADCILDSIGTNTSSGPQIDFGIFWEQRGKESRIFHFLRGRVHQTLGILFKEI